MTGLMVLLLLPVVVFLWFIFPVKKRRIQFDEKGEAIKIYQEEAAHIHRQFDKGFIDDSEKRQLLAELDKKSALAITAIEKKSFAYQASRVPLILVVVGLLIASLIYYRHYQQNGVMRWQAFNKDFHGQITEGLFDTQVVNRFVGSKDAETAATYCFAMQHELLAKYDNNPDALANVASCFATVGYPQLAEQAIERGLKNQANHPELNYLLAELQYRRDEKLSGDSIGNLLTVIKTRPDHFKAIRLLAVNSLNQGNYAQAKFFFGKLKDLVPSDNQELSATLARLLGEINEKISQSQPGTYPPEEASVHKYRANQYNREGAAASKITPATVNLSVALSPALARTLMGEYTLFVIVKTPQGKLLNTSKHLFTTSRQPLLVGINDNDDEMVKIENMVGHSRVSVVARISFNNSLIAQSGDLTSKPVTIALPQQGQLTALLIDRKVP